MKRLSEKTNAEFVRKMDEIERAEPSRGATDARHTPGPWTFDSYNTIFAKLEGPGVEDGIAVICSIPDHPSDGTYTPEESTERGWWYAQSEANAELLAQAWKIPDLLSGHVVLLEALRRLAKTTRTFSIQLRDFADDKGNDTALLHAAGESRSALVEAEAAIQQAERT